MIKKVFLIVFVIASFTSLAQKTTPDPNYKLIQGNDFIQAKNYYLLTLFQENKAVRKILENDPVLSNITKNKLDKLSTSLKDCAKEHNCYTEKMKFTDQEIKEIGQRLSQLYTKKNALGLLVANNLIPSGAYILYQHLVPKEMMVKAWELDAAGINFTIGVYAEGKKPNYPNIDSISFKVQGNQYSQLVLECSETVLEECKKASLFFTPSMTYALRFLEINERDEAADFEPMTSTVNKAAYEKIKNTNWNNYKYTLILVPGAGPDDPNVPLSAEGMLRCRVAAHKYFEGLAPFIMVSGGRVHPYKTKFSEALEMKHYLMKEMKVPESAIIMEPHARHTTTNMRNCARLIFRYGMPFQKPCLNSTTRSQSFYISDMGLDKRCQQELQHVPFKMGKRLSNTEVEFYPVLDALQVNPYEPLDP